MTPWRSFRVHVAAGLFLSLAAISPVRGQVIYVDADATGSGTGSNWADAYTDLQSALAWATSGWEIWVAEGQYTPTDGFDRTISFVLPDGVQLYGGFDGTETTRDERDWTIYESTLSGDVGVPDDSTDNSYHVMVAGQVGSSTVVDGFTVRHGRANTGIPPTDRGGGVYALNSEMVMRNSVFRWNGAALGGAIYTEKGSLTIEDCVFEDNLGNFGGGIYFTMDASALKQATLRRNRVGQLFFENGGAGIIEDVLIEDGETTGVFIFGSSPRFVRTTIRNNTLQSSDGGGISIDDKSAPVFEDCVIEGNSADAGGGAEIEGASTPLFVGTTFRENVGGGVKLVNSSATFIGCTFERNTDAGPGAISAVFSGITVLGSVLSGNRSTSSSAGGAVLFTGSTFLGDPILIANSVFAGNEAEQGGAIAAFGVDTGEAMLVNVTLAGNVGREAGGAIFSSDAAGLEIRNAILWGNTAPTDPEIHIDTGGAPIVERAIVADGYAPGTDILDTDPLFVRNPDPGPDGNWGTADDDYGDLRLREGSPAIDFGLEAFLPADIWDLDNDGNTTEPLPIDLNGDPRVQGAEVDLGPYEGAVVVANEPEAPEPEVSLSVFPNPARVAADLRFRLERPSHVRITVFDLLGREVATLADGRFEAGAYQATFDGSLLPSGMYLVRAAVAPENGATAETFTQRITLLK